MWSLTFDPDANALYVKLAELQPLDSEASECGDLVVDTTERNGSTILVGFEIINVDELGEIGPDVTFKNVEMGVVAEVRRWLRIVKQLASAGLPLTA